MGRNIQVKLFYIVLFFSIFSVFYYFLFSVIASFTVNKTEKKLLSSGITVLTSAFYNHISTVERIANDWSYWDDLYQYINDLNEGFQNSNLKTKTLQNTGINMILFFNQEGDIIYKTTVELEPDQKVNIPAQAFKKNENHSLYSLVLSVIKNKKGVSNLVYTLEGPLLFSLYPILPSNGTGEPKGAFLMGRYFNTQDQEDLHRASGLDFEIEAFVNAPAPVQEKFMKTDSFDDISPSTLTRFKLIRDSFNQPTMYFVFRYPRVVNNSYKEITPLFAAIAGFVTSIGIIVLRLKN